jgi:hypothetical protein
MFASEDFDPLRLDHAEAEETPLRPHAQRQPHESRTLRGRLSVSFVCLGFGG